MYSALSNRAIWGSCRESNLELLAFTLDRPYYVKTEKARLAFVAANPRVQ